MASNNDVKEMHAKDGVFDYKNHDLHSSKLIKNIQEYWESNQFCDVELVVGIEGQKILAHRIILVSSCDYFKGLLKPNMLEGKQSSVRCFDGLKSAVVLKLIEYCYSGRINFKVSSDIGIEHLLQAADYMRLQEICQQIAVFMKAQMNAENCLGFLQIADHYSLTSLRTSAFNYVESNYVFVVEAAEEFMSMPISLLQEFLKSERLVIQKDNIVLSNSEQEQFVVESVLKYVKHDLETRLPLLPGMMRVLKLPLLLEDQLNKLMKHEYIHGNPECITIIDLAKKTEPLKVTDTKGEPWAKPRLCQGLLLRELKEYAYISRVTPEIHTFNCRDVLSNDSTVYVCGLSIGMRRWDGREVIGGLQVFYSNGQNLTHGMNLANCETCKEFKLKSNERIVNIELNSGWMIDKLLFNTNLNNSYGPYGGDGGSTHKEPSSNISCPYLAGISGTVVDDQGLLGITKLKFMWGFYDFGEHSDVAKSDDITKMLMLHPSKLHVIKEEPYEINAESGLDCGDIVLLLNDVDIKQILDEYYNSYNQECHLRFLNCRTFETITVNTASDLQCFRKYNDLVDEDNSDFDSDEDF